MSDVAPASIPPAARGGWSGRAIVALALVAILGPFAWILTASFKTQIAIYAGQFPFTPTLSNYADVLFGRRSSAGAPARSSSAKCSMVRT